MVAIQDLLHPLTWLALVAVIVAGINYHVRRWLRQERYTRLLMILAWVVGFAGVTLFALGIVGMTGSANPSSLQLYGAFGLSSIVYIVSLRTRRRRSGQQQEELLEGHRIASHLIKLSVSAVIFLMLLTGGTGWATNSAIRHANFLSNNRSYFPSMVVFSIVPLNINEPGVNVRELVDVREGYRFRYSGLKMVASGKDQYFLAPMEGVWKVIVLGQSDSLRFEVVFE